tara:strand:- start:49 stop:222 length:174 start_codon:yes stop_codon:yes gene_type:complete
MDKDVKDTLIKRLEAEVGNLKVQNADYQQIVSELSEKLKAYDEKHGAIFIRSSSVKK